MKEFMLRKYLARGLACGLLLYLCGGLVLAQGRRRDHLSAAEADLVREAQIIDARTKVFIKAAERRFLALTNPAAATSKDATKDVEEWGAWPTGTRAELLGDMAGIVNEAINNIDGVAERNPQEKLLPKALRSLAEACRRWQPVLTAMQDKAQPDERQPLGETLEYIQSVLDASGTLPPEEKKK